MISGGWAMRLEDPGLENISDGAEQGYCIQVRAGHTKFTNVVENNGTLDQLKNQVQDHLVSSGRLLSA